MPREIVVKEAFRRAYQHLSPADQSLVNDALSSFENYLKTAHAPIGLRIKRLAPDVYEFRVSLSLRVVYVTNAKQVILALLGRHDQVHRFLRRQ